MQNVWEKCNGLVTTLNISGNIAVTCDKQLCGIFKEIFINNCFCTVFQFLMCVYFNVKRIVAWFLFVKIAK